jgi:hypothetical protein
MLNKDDILNCNDFDLIEMTVEEWGGIINLKAMSCYHKNKLQKHLAKNNKSDSEGNIALTDSSGLLERCVVYSVCDENGVLVFTESDIETLSKKNASVIERIAIKAKKISAFTETIIEDEKKD